MCAFSCIVNGYPTFNVGRIAGVEGEIGTFNDIDVMLFHSSICTTPTSFLSEPKAEHRFRPNAIGTPSRESIIVESLDVSH